jgi:hypothetical protein
MVVTELAERLRREELPAAAATAPIAWAQRLGYLLEHLGAPEKAIDLKAYVRARARQSTALLPGTPHENSARNKGWKLWVNAVVEPEL